MSYTLLTRSVAAADAAIAEHTSAIAEYQSRLRDNPGNAELQALLQESRSMIHTNTRLRAARVAEIGALPVVVPVQRPAGDAMRALIKQTKDERDRASAVLSSVLVDLALTPGDAGLAAERDSTTAELARLQRELANLQDALSTADSVDKAGRVDNILAHEARCDAAKALATRRTAQVATVAALLEQFLAEKATLDALQAECSSATASATFALDPGGEWTHGLGDLNTYAFTRIARIAEGDDTLEHAQRASDQLHDALDQRLQRIRETA